MRRVVPLLVACVLPALSLFAIEALAIGTAIEDARVAGETIAMFDKLLRRQPVKVEFVLADDPATVVSSPSSSLHRSSRLSGLFLPLDVEGLRLSHCCVILKLGNDLL